MSDEQELTIQPHSS